MEEYKSNSLKSKELTQEKKVVQQVVKTQGKVKKKTGFQKFLGNFISDDSQTVGDYIFNDVLIPAAKKTISEIVTNGIDIILYGQAGKSKVSSQIPAQRYSYASYYERNQRNYDRPVQSLRPSYSYDEIVVATRSEGEIVLNELQNIINKYQAATVADLYELVGITGNFTDNNYGWTSLDGSDVIRIRDGYLLKLPKPMAID